MEREIRVFGTSTISERYPVSTARDMSSWLIANITLVKTMYDLWSTNNIDDNTFDLAMVEGLEKIGILAEEIQEALEISAKRQHSNEPAN